MLAQKSNRKLVFIGSGGSVTYGRVFESISLMVIIL